MSTEQTTLSATIASTAPPTVLSYTPSVRDIRAQYDEESMTFRLDIPFKAVGDVVEKDIVTELAEVPGVETEDGFLDLSGSPVPSYSKLPGRVRFSVTVAEVQLVWSSGVDHLQSTPRVIEVQCFLCQKSISPIGSNSVRDVTGVYMGRITGTHASSTRMQMCSVPIFQSLRKETDGTYRGIGVEFDGTTTQVPLSVRSVIECLPLLPFVDSQGMVHSSWDTLEAQYAVLAGSVNEEGWIPPWGDRAQPCVEGTHLYYGVTDVQVDRKTRTVFVRHDFIHNAMRCHQGVYPFQEYTQSYRNVVGIGYRPVRDYKGSWLLAVVQPVAGTDLTMCARIGGYVELVPTWASIFSFTRILVLGAYGQIFTTVPTTTEEHTEHHTTGE